MHDLVWHETTILLSWHWQILEKFSEFSDIMSYLLNWTTKIAAIDLQFKASSGWWHWKFFLLCCCTLLFLKNFPFKFSLVLKFLLMIYNIQFLFTFILHILIYQKRLLWELFSGHVIATFLTKWSRIWSLLLLFSVIKLNLRTR